MALQPLFPATGYCLHSASSQFLYHDPFLLSKHLHGSSCLSLYHVRKNWHTNFGYDEYVLYFICLLIYDYMFCIWYTFTTWPVDIYHLLLSWRLISLFCLHTTWLIDWLIHQFDINIGSLKKFSKLHLCGVASSFAVAHALGTCSIGLGICLITCA